jgi:hypothetical protein
MGYRVIFLANPVKLSVKNEQLVIDNQGTDIGNPVKEEEPEVFEQLSIF